MTAYIFNGRVVPEVHRIRTPWTQRFNYEDPASGFKAEFSIQFHASLVHVVCISEADHSEDLFKEAMVRSFQFCTTMANVITFAMGWSLHVIIDSAYANGELRPIALSEAKVRSLCTSFNVDEELEQVSDLALQDLSLAFALSDLAAGVGQLNYSSVAAGRALDTVRHAIAGPDTDMKDSWSKLRQTLNVSEQYAKSISGASAKPRHGERGKIDGATELAVLLRAWTVVDRYIHFKKLGGVHPLPIESFPILRMEGET